MPVKILSSDRFTKNVRDLHKHYPHVTEDIDVLLKQLRNGATPGERISGVGYSAYKVRVKSKDINRGTDSAFRLLYYLQTKDCVFLVTIYTKSQQQDIPNKALKRLIDNMLRLEKLRCD